MTSKLTRERLAEIAQFGFSSAITPANDFEIKELARLVLSAMDGEPVAEVVSIYGDPEAFGEREIRPLVGIQKMPYGTKLYRHAQQAPVVSADLLHTAASAIEDLLTTKDRTGACVWFDLPFRLRSAANAQPAPEYQETLPCPVLLEPGMRFGKGVKTRLVLEAIQRRAEHYAELEAMTPEERAEYDAGIEAFKAMLPPPATVVPDEVTAEYCPALVKYDVTEVDEAWARGFNACRAAVLQAKSLYSINPAPDLVSLQKKAESIIGNYPGIPDGSEHCPCCGKKLRRACSVEGCGGKHVAHGLCQKHYDMKRWEDPEQVERFREADRRYRGKKKTTVTTPQEPKP